MDKRKIEALLFLAKKDCFTIGECEQLAKDLDAFDSMTFELVGPTGRLKARWSDAYFGLFQIDGQDNLMAASSFQYVADVHCENLAFAQVPA